MKIKCDNCFEKYENEFFKKIILEDGKSSVIFCKNCIILLEEFVRNKKENK